MNRLQTLVFLTVLTISPLLAQDGEPTAIRVTHGPILGRPTTTSMTLWVRTNDEGPVRIFYGTEEGNLDQVAPVLTTSIEHDNTGLVTIEGLSPNTRYFYRIEDHQLDGAFTTMPDPEHFRNVDSNPEGLFNFSFEFACGNNQRGNGDSAGPHLPVYDVLNSDWREKVHFAILNGDWL
ncbi:MAG: fibronectin type III domain-containing protein, partial [Verrucomicrobiota bacterium]